MGFLVVLLLGLAVGTQLDLHVTVPSNTAGTVVELAALAPHNQIDFVNRDDAHITLYLTDFQDDKIAQVVLQAKKALSQAWPQCTVKLSGFDVGTAYAMWNVALSDCLQMLSDAVVNATYTLATPNQAVPPWVNSLPPAERAAKTAMVRKYGSPNVFGQFQPHLTVAYDTVDSLGQLYGSRNDTGSFVVSSVAVSPTGPFGTVLKGKAIATIALDAGQQEAFDYCNPSSNFDWDYFLMVREWPGTISPGPLPSFVDSFTMHGLWPNRNDGSYPACCNNNYPFSYAEIEPIIADVKRIWYDTLHDQTNGTSFWSHEWDKHGTCAMLGDPSCCGSELKYFQTCVNLHDQMTEVQWLSNAGIYPADPSSTTYSTDKFISAIASSLGQTPLIKCTNKNGNTVIEDIAVCVSKQLEIIACPYEMMQSWNSSANCGSSFGFPQIPH